ncbi:hypothetical protein V6N12_057000 [Hibiscus sabdariffa]|uniref:Uncharacterized protein n=1 Tax=Hibiscus sabdariffa TaxID=183260 RepID=A0ABR2DCP9_9ROSI
MFSAYKLHEITECSSCETCCNSCKNSVLQRKGSHNVLCNAFAQVATEIPYTIAQAAIYNVVVVVDLVGNVGFTVQRLAEQVRDRRNSGSVY